MPYNQTFKREGHTHEGWTNICKSTDESSPYYTIEVRGQRAVQVRGLRNCSATPEVEEFIKAWEQRVLSRIDTAA